MRLVLLLDELDEQVTVNPTDGDLLLALSRVEDDDGSLFLEQNEDDWVFTTGEHVECQDWAGRHLLSDGYAEPEAVRKVLLAYLHGRSDWKSQSGPWKRIPDEHMCFGGEINWRLLTCLSVVLGVIGVVFLVCSRWAG